MVQTTSRREIRFRMEALSRRKEARQGENYRIVMFSLDGLGSPQMNCRKLCLGEMSHLFRLVPIADLSPGRTNSFPWQRSSPLPITTERGRGDDARQLAQV